MDRLTVAQRAATIAEVVIELCSERLHIGVEMRASEQDAASGMFTQFVRRALDPCPFAFA